MRRFPDGESRRWGCSIIQAISATAWRFTETLRCLTHPVSHGCIRIPNSAAVEMSRQLPVGTIVLIYDSQAFVSAKSWAEADKQKTVQNLR